MSQKTLAIELSRLNTFIDPSTNLEQYSTESNIAAELIWDANNFDLIKNKTIVDLGAGTGILGIGCILMGAKKVIFVEQDSKAIEILKENLALVKEKYDFKAAIEILNKDVKEFDKNVDLVIQNPPFGTKIKNVDTVFLEKAMTLTKKIITLHKTTTDKYIQDLAQKQGFSVKRRYLFDFPLKKTMPQHKKKVEHIKVTGWLLEKNN